MNPRVIRLLLLIVVSILVGYYVGVTKITVDWHNYNPHIVAISKEPPPGETDINMSQFWTVMDKINANYYDRSKIDPQKIENGAIQGAIATLDDPFTLYLPPENNTDFKQQLSGQFEGIGAELGMKGKQIIVISPLDGSPAEKAGIKAGDAIVSINNQSTTGMNLNDAVTKIRGPKGTTITLGIQHKSASQPQNITVTRDTINVKSVSSWIKQVKDIPNIDHNVLSANATDKVAYIQLSQFGDNTDSEWQQVASKIATSMQEDSSIKGVILDLRNNPGGYLTDAQFVASEFIPSGTVVIQEDGRGNQTPLDVNRKGLLTNVPVVVLINKGSASAAEIVSGALRDHGRAQLIGEQSFGKGTIQEAEDLGSGAGLHVTIGKWLTPNGTWLGNGTNGTGLKPDITVALNPKDPTHDTQLEKAVQTLVQ